MEAVFIAGKSKTLTLTTRFAAECGVQHRFFPDTDNRGDAERPLLIDCFGSDEPCPLMWVQRTCLLSPGRTARDQERTLTTHASGIHSHYYPAMLELASASGRRATMDANGLT